MDWVLLSLASAIAFTAFTIVQKRALDRYVRSAVTFYAITAVMQLSIAVVLLSFWPPELLTTGVAVMVAVGILQAVMHLLQGYAIKRATDVSRIVPVFDSFPLPVFILAVAFLGEELTPLKLAAVFMVISGAMLASWRKALPGDRMRISRPLVAILAATLVVSVMTILFKVASADLTVLQMVGLSWLFSSPTYLVAARIGHAGEDIRAALRSVPAMGHIGAAHVVMLVSILSGLAAIAIGPVSLSSAIMGTRPVFLLLFVMASGFGFRDAMRRGHRHGLPRTSWASASLVSVGVGVMAF